MELALCKQCVFHKLELVTKTMSLKITRDGRGSEGRADGGREVGIQNVDPERIFSVLHFCYLLCCGRGEIDIIPRLLN